MFANSPRSRVTPHVARRAERQRLKLAIARARERVCAENAFSPSWDAAMAALDDLERQLSRFHRPS